MTTNQLSLLRTAMGRAPQFREHLTRRPARTNVMPCAFASLRLCVLTASVLTQRRRGAKTQRGRGQEAVDGIGRPRATAENRSARLLTAEPWTASGWRERGWAVQASVSCHVPGGSSPALASVVIREIRVIRGQPLLVKLDDLPQHILGATMAMFNVLVLGTRIKHGKRKRSDGFGKRGDHGEDKLAASPERPLLGIRVPSVFHPWLS